MDSSVSKGRFYAQLRVTSVLLVGGLPWYLASSTEFIHFLNLESLLKTRVSSHYVLFKSYEAKSSNNRNFILKCMEKYEERKFFSGHKMAP